MPWGSLMLLLNALSCVIQISITALPTQILSYLIIFQSENDEVVKRTRFFGAILLSNFSIMKCGSSMSYIPINLESVMFLVDFGFFFEFLVRRLFRTWSSNFITVECEALQNFTRICYVCVGPERTRWCVRQKCLQWIPLLIEPCLFGVSRLLILYVIFVCISVLECDGSKCSLCNRWSFMYSREGLSSF